MPIPIMIQGGIWKPRRPVGPQLLQRRDLTPITCPSGRRLDGDLSAGPYWRYSEHRFKDLDRGWQNLVGVPDGNNVPAIKKVFFPKSNRCRVPQTLWTYNEVGHTQEAKKELLRWVKFPDSDSTFEIQSRLGFLKRILQLGTSASTRFDHARFLCWVGGVRPGSRLKPTLKTPATAAQSAVQIARSRLGLEAGERPRASDYRRRMQRERIRNAGSEDQIRYCPDLRPISTLVSASSRSIPRTCATSTTLPTR